jgi:hypothetical protein
MNKHALGEEEVPVTTRLAVNEEETMSITGTVLPSPFSRDCDSEISSCNPSSTDTSKTNFARQGQCSPIFFKGEANIQQE